MDSIAKNFAGRKTKEISGEHGSCHFQLPAGIGGRINRLLDGKRIRLVGDYQWDVVWVDIERHAALRMIRLLWCPRHHSDAVDHRTHRQAQRAA